MRTYKLNGAAVEIISKRSVNNRRWCKVRKPDGSIEEVLYRELEREYHRDSGAPVLKHSRKVDIAEVRMDLFTPRQQRLIREGRATTKMVAMYLRQNGSGNKADPNNPRTTRPKWSWLDKMKYAQKKSRERWAAQV